MPRSPTLASSTGLSDRRKRGKEKLKREGEVEDLQGARGDAGGDVELGGVRCGWRSGRR